jgi:hypothetical protein
MVLPSTGRSGANHTTRWAVAGTADAWTAAWDMERYPSELHISSVMWLQQLRSARTLHALAVANALDAITFLFRQNAEPSGLQTRQAGVMSAQRLNRPLGAKNLRESADGSQYSST